MPAWIFESRLLTWRSQGALDSQRAVRKSIFGGGYLLSENKAAELKAAELKAAEDVTVWTLNDKEKQIIGKLG